jgi:hypothetical protein
LSYYSTTYFTVTGPDEDIAGFKAWCAAEGLKLKTLEAEPGRSVCVTDTKWYPPGEIINKMPGFFPNLVIDIVGHDDYPAWISMSESDGAECPAYEGRIANGVCEHEKVLGRIEDPEKLDDFWRHRLEPMIALERSPNTNGDDTEDDLPA